MADKIYDFNAIKRIVVFCGIYLLCFERGNRTFVLRRRKQADICVLSY